MRSLLSILLLAAQLTAQALAVPHVHAGDAWHGHSVSVPHLHLSWFDHAAESDAVDRDRGDGLACQPDHDADALYLSLQVGQKGSRESWEAHASLEQPVGTVQQRAGAGDASVRGPFGWLSGWTAAELARPRCARYLAYRSLLI